MRRRALIRLLRRPAARALAAAAAALAMACAGTMPRPEETPASPVAQPDGGPDAGTVSMPAADGGLPEITAETAGVPSPEETKKAETGASERRKEEAEISAKEEADKAAVARLKAAQDQLNAVFDEAFSQIKAGKDDEAISQYQGLLKDHPEAFAAHYNLGVLYERKGQRDNAIDQYREALRLKPDYEAASDNLSRLYLRSGQTSRAAVELRARILHYPRQLAFRNQLVRVFMAEGRLDQAESDSKKVLKIDERNVDAMLNLALIWYGQKKYELAKQVLESARDIVDKRAADNPAARDSEPYAPAVWNLLAFTQLNLDQRTLALDSFRRAAALRPDYPEAHNNYGAMLNEVNDCDDATRELELAVRYAPDYAEAHLNLGNAYRCSHKYKEAQGQYDRALSLNAKSLDPIFNTAILFLDGFDMEVEYDKTSPLDSAKLERLKKAVHYFEQFRSSGGEDDRFDRYYDEATKDVAAEQKRLERTKDQAAREAERQKRDEERKKQEAAKAKEEAAKRATWVQQYRVAGKSDIEDDQPAMAPAPTAPVVAPAPEVAPNAELKPPRKMEKLTPKEDF